MPRTTSTKAPVKAKVTKTTKAATKTAPVTPSQTRAEIEAKYLIAFAAGLGAIIAADQAVSLAGTGIFQLLAELPSNPTLHLANAAFAALMAVIFGAGLSATVYLWGLYRRTPASKRLLALTFVKSGLLVSLLTYILAASNFHELGNDAAVAIDTMSYLAVGLIYVFAWWVSEQELKLWSRHHHHSA